MKKNCPKAGIKIHETQSSQFSSDNIDLNIDLNLENYSCHELFNLFGIQGRQLDDQLMKSVKKIVLKTHPDKSKLHSDYYIFFSKAYNRLFSLYKSQNIADKNMNNVNTNYSTIDEREKTKLLDNFFDKNKNFKNNNHFNKWFNDKFEKHHIKEEEHG